MLTFMIQIGQLPVLNIMYFSVHNEKLKELKRFGRSIGHGSSQVLKTREIIIVRFRSWCGCVFFLMRSCSLLSDVLLLLAF
jgi:hypothetical protein